MKILETLNGSILALGSIIPNAIEEVSRGATFDHSTIHLGGNPVHAKIALKHSGIDAWAVVFIRKEGSIDVRKKDKDRAMKTLRDNGFECW